MALGRSKVQPRFEDPRVLLGDRLRGIYLLLAEHGRAMFGDGYFADLYKASTRGRPTVPARVLATVMILQSHEGLSDQEACDRLERDLAWQAAAGVDTAAASFHPTTLVGVRNRLRSSGRPRRLFTDTKVAAGESGVMGARVRVLDSTPIYDSVATQDTVTQLRSAIRKLLRALDRDYPALAAKVRAVLARDDDYAGPGKPSCDWDDPAAREVLVDALVGDCAAALAALDGEELEGLRWQRSSCWRLSPAKTSTRTTTECSALSGASLPIGSSRRSIPRPATDTRAMTAVSTATRRICRSTLTPS